MPLTKVASVCFLDSKLHWSNSATAHTPTWKPPTHTSSLTTTALTADTLTTPLTTEVGIVVRVAALVPKEQLSMSILGEHVNVVSRHLGQDENMKYIFNSASPEHLFSFKYSSSKQSLNLLLNLFETRIQFCFHSF